MNRRFNYIPAFTLALTLVFFLAVSLLPGEVQAQGGFVTCSGTDCGSCDLVNMINSIIKWLFGIAAVLFGVLMMIAGLGLVTSGGNTSALEDAKSKFKNAIIGLIIMMSAWLVIDALMRGLLPGDSGQINGVLFWADVQCTQQTTAKAFEPPDESDPGTAPPPVLPPLPTSPKGQVCYAGDGSGQVCFPAYEVPNQSPYNYPAGMARPAQFMKYSEVGGKKVSKYYSLCDVTRCAGGRIGDYFFIDPRAVQGLDRVTDILGGNRLTINSGFRSPAYNAQIEKSAPQSTHMRGIAFDISARNGLTTAQIERACKQAGAGWTRQYPTFTHCDWR